MSNTAVIPSAMTTVSITDLPEDVLGLLLGTLPAAEQHRCRRVCRTFRTTVDSTVTELDLSACRELTLDRVLSLLHRFPALTKLVLATVGQTPFVPAGGGGGDGVRNPDESEQFGWLYMSFMRPCADMGEDWLGPIAAAAPGLEELRVPGCEFVHDRSLPAVLAALPLLRCLDVYGCYPLLSDDCVRTAREAYPHVKLLICPESLLPLFADVKRWIDLIVRQTAAEALETARTFLREYVDMRSVPGWDEDGGVSPVRFEEVSTHLASPEFCGLIDAVTKQVGVPADPERCLFCRDDHADSGEGVMFVWVEDRWRMQNNRYFGDFQGVKRRWWPLWVQYCEWLGRSPAPLSAPLGLRDSMGAGGGQ